MAGQRSTSDSELSADDEAAAVRDAVGIFWRYGLGGTTTRTLERELDLRGRSIQDVFGTKKALRNRAISDYLGQVDELLLQPIERPDSTAVDLKNFVDKHVGLIGDQLHPGCLLVNLVTEAGSTDDFLATSFAAFRKRLGTSVAAVTAKLDPDLAAERSSQFVTAFFGICSVARSGASADELNEIAAATKAQVDAWM